MISFTFPENKTFNYGRICDLNSEFKIEDLDITTPTKNVISINKRDYCFTNLYSSGKNKGGHSIILKLYDLNNIDLVDLNYGDPDFILKISNEKKSNNPIFQKPSEKRFLKEIEALLNCKENEFFNVIRLEDSGECKIYNNNTTKWNTHRCYLMEYAKHDLKSFIEENYDVLSIHEKLELCISLAEGLKELESLGYYHRDLKPDNIFMINGDWKVGDLGLINNRNNDFGIDKPAEFIGPRGWISPEAMNKFLCEKTGFESKFNCTIDHQSDLFQLGKVFWYIFQHNAPIGTVKQDDFILRNTRIYSVIKTMLNHSKERRYLNISEVIDLLKPISKGLLRSA